MNAIRRPSSSWVAVLALGATLLLGACTAAPAATTAPPSSTPSATPSAPATPAPSPTAAATTMPTPSMVPSPSIGMCAPGHLAARITLWEGASGHRIADVELTNTDVPCILATLDQPQLVDGTGAVLIDSAAPAGPAEFLHLMSGQVVKTLVQDGNYCGPAPTPPVSVAFVLPDGVGRVVAEPVSAADAAGVPPCTGSGESGDIEMHPWAP